MQTIKSQFKPASLVPMAGDMHSLLSSCLHSIIVTMVLVYKQTQVHSLTLESDIQILRSIREAIDPTSIPRYSYLHSWDFSLDPCERTGAFLGILCTFPLDNSSHRITAIDLDDVGYDGFLAPSIGNLTELTTLGLSNNNFRGPIPETIACLRRLTRLSLSHNHLTGRIPPKITDLQQLEILDLSQNRLSGSIPTNITVLRSLTHVSLSNNAFSGRIPDLSGLWQLNTLDLGHNHLYGILPKLPTNLRTLALSHNALSGHISPVRMLRRLTSLDVSNNNLSGHISYEVLTLPSLVHIDISENQFTAMEAIENPERETQLQVLDAHANQLQGHLPPSLAAVKSLTTIDLSHNQFIGPIPMEYGAKLENSWKSLFLNDNFLIGNLPPEFNHTLGIRGSLANNCLTCPTDITLCQGRQKPSSECAKQYMASDEKSP